MYSKYWEIIKDDSKKTFEVCDQTTDTNFFVNNIHGMQKAGMNVSCLTPPVTNKAPNRDSIKIAGYTKEEGLKERLLNDYREITRKLMDDW